MIDVFCIIAPSRPLQMADLSDEVMADINVVYKKYRDPVF